MSQEFCIDRFPDQIKNSLQFYRWSLNKLMIQYESREITLMDYSDAHQEIIIKAEEMYKDEIEAVIINQCAERSTENASTYSEGYTQGYKRALEYMTDIIKTKIKTKNNEQR